MRTLLPHSVLALAALLVVCLAAGAVSVPSPIGKLSDYGAVFDRHDREEVNRAIADIASLLHIDVYLLLSWESPYPTVEPFAAAVFAAWNLASKPTILAVFLRSGSDWAASVVVSPTVAAQLGAIDKRLEERMADLVAHRRVEEAVRAMFGELRGLPAAQRAIEAEARARTTGAPTRGAPIAVLVAAVVGAVAVLALLIRWRVCPRCAGLLRRERTRFGTLRTANRVYSCRRCGYRRGR